jgi:hypothetical protein
MYNLIKFEFARKKMSLAIAAALTVIGQIFVLFKFFQLDEVSRNAAGDEIFGIFLGVTMVGFGILYFIDIIFLFRNDLFKQEGYMLFMTPHNGYTILGSKLIFGLLEGLAIAIVYVGLLFLNLKVMLNVPIDFEMIGVNGIMIMTGIKGLILGIFMLIEFALTVYLSFALFKSLFNNTRFKGLITFGIFIVINIVKSKFVEVVANILGKNFTNVEITATDLMLESVNTAINYGLVATILSAVILFIGTGYLLENRINL